MTTINDLKNAAGEAAEAISALVLAVYKAFQEGRTKPQNAPEVIKAVRDVIKTIGEIPMPAPEGVEFAMRVYIQCDTADLRHVLNFPGNHMLPPRSTDQIFVGELIDQLPDEENRRLRACGLWRVMTRPEIARYKRDMARAAEEIQASKGPAGFNRRQ